VELDDMDQTFLRRQHISRIFKQYSKRYAGTILPFNLKKNENTTKT
jgi:hypothetical protein